MSIFEYIAENYLMSEFKVGFEIEMIMKKELAQDREERKLFLDWIKEQFGGKIKGDPSIKPNHPDDEDIEYASSPQEFTPMFQRKFNDFLMDLNMDPKIYTNQTCGMHIHISFPYINEQEMFWVLCNLATDNSMYFKINTFKNRYDFFSKEFADKEYLEGLSKAVLDYSLGRKQRGINALNKYFSMDKYRSFRMHEIGTLEWRGPRGFLNARKLETIEAFGELLRTFIQWMSRILSPKHKMAFTDWTKQEFFDLLKEHDIGFEFMLGKHQWADEMTKEKIIQIAEKFPWIKKAKISDANIRIGKQKGEEILVWKTGVWIDGVWEGGRWQDGTWKGGEWKSGEWHDGVWQDGIWHGGVWHDGVWEDGKWLGGRWRDGVWLRGTDENNKEHEMSPDDWGMEEDEDEEKNDDDEEY